MDERYGLELTGTVKSVIFQNEENGYTVLRLDVGGEEPVTVVGCLPFAAPGEGLWVEGTWEMHPSHGQQFKAASAGGASLWGTGTSMSIWPLGR